VNVVWIDQAPFKHSMSPSDLSDALALIGHCREKTNAWVACLHEAIAAHDLSNQADLHAALTASPEAIIASAIAANRKLKARDRGTLEDCLKLAATLDFTTPIPEIVYVWPQPKTKGGYRMICKFGLMHRTAQDIVARIMNAHFVPRPFQYSHLGVHAAIRDAKALINKGYTFAAHLDIADYFCSFDPEKLHTELPLPADVVENAVIGRHMEMGLKQGLKVHPYYDLSPSTLLEKARLGIPQGSGSSSIVSTYCMSRLQWVLIEGVALLNVADDFLLLATNRDARGKGVDALVAAIGNLPGGTFEISVKSKSTAAQGIRFLGHEMQFKDGIIRTWPAAGSHDELLEKLLRIEGKLAKLLCHIGHHFGGAEKAAAIEHLARYFAVIAGWRAAFSECEALDQLLADVYQSGNEWCAKVGVSVEKVKAAITPDMECRPNGY
jgi:hypothetical protein